MIISDKQAEFVVTARKWRPLRFADVVGQEHITQTISNAIKTGRVHHAFLFCGPRGVGKTTTARILARALNCLQPENSEPCNKCENCLPALESRSMDVIEIDGASNNSVDDVRKLRENSKYPPINGKYKIYVIDEVHMLSNSAFNALLKTLEEPPSHLLFVFATTESHKLPATIISRCQRFDFRRMEIKDITEQLRYIAGREGITIDEESLLTIAKKADGSMRDSQSIFDQVAAFCGKDIKYADMAGALHLIDQDFFFRISNAILARDAAEMFIIAEEVISKGYDLQDCLHGLLEHIRNILTIKATGKTNLIDSSQSYIEKYIETAERFTKGDLLRFINLINQTEQALRFSPQPRIRFELALVQLASLDSAIELGELLEEIKTGTTTASFTTTLSATPKSEPQARQSLPSVDEIKQETIKPPSVVKEPEPVKSSAYANNNILRSQVSADEISSQWAHFLQKYANAQFGLTIIKQMSPKFLANEIILQTDQDFSLNIIQTKKAELSNLVNEFYNAKIAVRLIKTDEVQLSEALPSNSEVIEKEVNIEEKNNFIAEKSSLPNKYEVQLAGKHPIEAAIFKEFYDKDIEEIIPE